MSHIAKQSLQQRKKLGVTHAEGPSIKYVRKIFRKNNISTPVYAHVRLRIRWLEMLVFRKTLRTCLMIPEQIHQSANSKV